MKAIVYDRPYAFRYTDLPDPEPGPAEVRLRVLSAGVCGTDAHLHRGEFSPRYPLTPGHEVVGEVESMGEGVTTLAVGQRVALNNRVSCGTCANCRRARPAFCTRLRDHGVTRPGGFAEMIVVPASHCHPADDIPLDVVAFAEPVACAVHGMDVLAPQPGSDVLVFGAGTTGLLLAQLLAASGAGRVTVAAPTEAKLKLARDFGADETVVMDRHDASASRVALRTLAPDGFDTVVDATGALAVIEQCLPLTRDGGTVFLYGMAGERERIELSPHEIFSRELTVRGSFTQAFSFDRALRVLRTGRVRTDGMITHRFGLDSYGAALDAVRDDRGCIKAVIHP
ncbi:zinc-dependent alcohol dehydrogenase family protein [Streptomyces sp. NEAU-YJ-81]|uniref:zinc-dependent alcohol dehydrogenase family protein n=1 Tax=Streptomyces sp. NEAU-YJ-81 TaxID=2820288 RepID=UPI001ABBFE98|nr:zinc-dependent alcohol dehydrogenase family protein [Streptomyces sp. NEAU-YJ-81]MBO3676374.1 zinc-dependent alcohol dehydrogenase family protein [Streptomyces sp. NEAU-YJ-81]